MHGGMGRKKKLDFDDGVGQEILLLAYLVFGSLV
jgi:hypothetical protein